ncbi:MAG: FxLYD domain-containing protein [Dehalococcoidia bacterium]|nr:FxLYD domain-containing protein [Dehalococcoidia bacterium]
MLVLFIMVGTPCASRTSLPNPIKPNATLQVQLVNWCWYPSSDLFYVAEGKIKNLTSEDMDGVKAVFSVYDEKGNLLKNEAAEINAKSHHPGKTSVFRVVATFHPKACQGRMDFRDFYGDFLMVDRNGEPALKPMTKP